ncbi:hypothetical protein D3C87_1354610 [compost metagenome]
MEHHAGVLQQRVQVAPLHGRRQQADERVGGEQQEQQEAHADGAQHTDHAGPQRRRQAAAEARHGQRPERQHQRPQQHRALVPAPDRRRAIDRRQRGIRVGRHVAHAEVVVEEGQGQRAIGRQHQQRLGHGGGAGHGHQRGVAARTPRGAGNRQHRLHHGNEQREDQGEVAEFDDHRGVASGVRALVWAACFRASAASGGM